MGPAIERLTLVDFRNHADLSLEVEGRAGLVLLSGPNGAGKTNILEALSLLAPGRGLRGARLSTMARTPARPPETTIRGFSISARLRRPDPLLIGTGATADAPERRRVRINGAEASPSALGEWVAALWLTPAMDRLFTGPAADRRQFVDRLTLALDPHHARAAARYERAMRERTKLLGQDHADPAWLKVLEQAMAETGVRLFQARNRLVHALGARLAEQATGPFARAGLALTLSDGSNSSSGATLDPANFPWAEETAFATCLAAMRARDAAAGRALVGPHRFDLAVTHLDKAIPAALASTGEQKALLIGIILAHSALVADLTERAPLLLLDEVAAHLDPVRRNALFERLAAIGSQTWLTATEAALFAEAKAVRHFQFQAGGTIAQD